MESWLLAQRAEIAAIEAEIEGMKAENNQRISQSQGMAYVEVDFLKKAEELRSIALLIMKNR